MGGAGKRECSVSVFDAAGNFKQILDPRLTRTEATGEERARKCFLHIRCGIR